MKKRLVFLIVSMMVAQAVFAAFALRMKQRYLSQEVGPGQINEVAVMNGTSKELDTQGFRGGYIRAIMGGIELDLRHATIAEKPAVVETTILMGGVELKVPEDWVVDVRADAKLGGVQDSRRHGAHDGREPDLVITGSIAMGGLEIDS